MVIVKERRQNMTESNSKVDVNANMPSIKDRKEYHMTAHSPEELHLTDCSHGRGLECDVRNLNAACRCTWRHAAIDILGNSILSMNYPVLLRRHDPRKQPSAQRASPPSAGSVPAWIACSAVSAPVSCTFFRMTQQR